MVLLDGTPVNLKAYANITHWANLKGLFWVRAEYRLWTNRRYLNGVIQLTGKLLGDAILEYVIEGVMEDIQGILTVNSLSYSDWTNITLVPTLIRRATTYGVVASLYARHTLTFEGRVVPSVAPVTITVISDAERAMNHWEKRMEKAINDYITTQSGSAVIVSTEDEEPIFSMEDIPEEVTSETTWHVWLKQR